MAGVVTRDPGAARRGILWMLLTVMMFVSVSAMVKKLALTYPVPEVLWARFFFHSAATIVVFGPRLPRLMAGARVGVQMVRSTLFLTVSALFFVMVHVIPLAAASSIMFLVPVMITALSVPLLREPVGLGRWISVAVGFAGAMLIIRPEGGLLQTTVVVPLGAALSQALYEITTRLTGRGDSALTTAAYTPLAGLVATSAAVPFFWQAPDAFGWGLMAALGVVSFISQFTLIKAYHAAPAAIVAPFTYTMLIWATVYGYVLFDEVPAAETLLGAAIIVGSGLYIFYGGKRAAGKAEEERR